METSIYFSEKASLKNNDFITFEVKVSEDNLATYSHIGVVRNMRDDESPDMRIFAVDLDGNYRKFELWDTKVTNIQKVY
jgi:hypothetical protein